MGHRDPTLGTGALLSHLTQSLMFIPHFSPATPPSLLPYLAPGWTLNYEMFFYVIFAVGLLTGRVVLVTVATIVALVAAGIAHRTHSALWLTYTDPLLLEFLAGVLIGKFRTYLVRPATALLLPIGLLGVFTLSPDIAPRALSWGLPAAFLLLGALALDARWKHSEIRPLSFLGDASYSIYLFQMVGINAAARIVQMMPVSGSLQLAIMILLSIAAACAAGCLVYVFVEKRISRILRASRR
jgi:exopolysaccharide production protein ExoZ